MGPYHNGTFELAKQVLRRASRRWAQSEVLFMASDEARRLISLMRSKDSIRTGVDQAFFGVALRIGQPFRTDHVSRTGALAAVNVYTMSIR